MSTTLRTQLRMIYVPPAAQLDRLADRLADLPATAQHRPRKHRRRARHD